MRTKIGLSLFWKVIWSITLALAFLGLLLWIVGGMFGGCRAAKELCREIPTALRDSGAWENGRIPVKGGWDIDRGFPVITGTGYENMNIAGADQVDNIMIEAGGCELRIESAENGSYGIAARELQGELQCYVEKRTLYVKYGPRTWNQLSSEKADSFTLYLPGNAQLQEMEMDLGAGNFTAEQIAADEVRLSVGAANVSINGFAAEEAEIEVGAGNTTIEGASLGRLEVQVGMGNFSMQGSTDDDIEVETGMGTVYLNLEGKETDYNYDTDCALGNIHIGTQSSMRVFAEGEIINEAAQKDMSLDCAMGEIQVIFAE